MITGKAVSGNLKRQTEEIQMNHVTCSSSKARKPRKATNTLATPALRAKLHVTPSEKPNTTSRSESENKVLQNDAFSLSSFGSVSHLHITGGSSVSEGVMLFCQA